MNASGHAIGCNCSECLALQGETVVVDGHHAKDELQGSCLAREEITDGCACYTHKSESHKHTNDGCGCSEGSETLDKTILGRIIVTAILLAVGLLADVGQWITIAVFALGIAIIGYDIFYRAVRNLFKERSLDENLLMGIACVGAFFIGEYSEGVLVMLLYQIGELFQGYAVGNSRKSIRSLVDMRPETVNVVKNGVTQQIEAKTAVIGDIILVKPGERVALDGTVVKGETTIDTSALTGESLARTLGVGESVMSGCVNLTGAIKIEVTATLEKSAVSRIMGLVEEAAEQKAQPEKFITRFAKVYTPIVFAAAIIVAVFPPLMFGHDWYTWTYRALTFLVISCPCALVISVPLTYFAGIGGASRKGVLFKGSNSMDILSRVGTVVFDKTGTLTTGHFRVTEVKPSEGVSHRELLETAAYAECFSDHPLARSIVSAYGGEIDESKISQYSEQRGKGVSTMVEGRRVVAGNRSHMREQGINIPPGLANTTVYVAVDDEYMGRVLLGDTNKTTAFEAVGQLKRSHIGVVMLTGDSSEAASKTAESLGINDYYAQCLPEDKAGRLREIMDSCKDTVAFVGDGINDAPVLAMSDVGIAMGGIGSDAAIEAADAVIMNDEPSKVLTAIDSAKRTDGIAKQNITFALVVKTLFLILGALGYSGMAAAIFADVGVTLLAILNAMRASR